MVHVNAPVVLVGAGRMGGALLEGWLEEGLDPGGVFVQDPAPSDPVADLISKYDITVSDQVALSRPAGVIVLAVKPQLMDLVLPGLVPLLGSDTLVLSIAAGRTVRSIEGGLNAACAVIRSMPNTPAAIGRGISAAYANERVGEDQKTLADSLLSAVGDVVWLENESEMDAVTAVSGSGPAYVFYLVECLTEAGVAEGLNRELAQRLAVATLCGSGDLLRQTEESPDILRKNVTSPGGTTEAALNVLMSDGGLETLMKEAVRAAAERASVLSS